MMSESPVVKDTGRGLFAGLILILLFVAEVVRADQVELRDGSRLVGEVLSLQDGTLKMETAFAGPIEIPADQVLGISTDGEVMVTLGSGDRLAGVARYSEEAGQTLVTGLFGEIRLDEGREMVALSRREAAAEADAASRRQARHEQEMEELKQQHAEEVATLKAAKAKDPWSGDIALGVNGASGNSDRFGISGRAEARRATNGDRLMLYTEGNLQEESGETTANEVLAGGTLERDLDRHWFVFGSVDFEKDEFEELELRALANMGIGHFLFRREDLTWKALAGVGYQHETFENNGVQEEAIISFGYDLSYHYNAWVELMHKLTYFPSFTSPTEDYRLVSNFAAQMPIGNTENWKIRLNLRNQYDAEPRPGIEELDTVYSINIVYDFD